MSRKKIGNPMKRAANFIPQLHKLQELQPLQYLKNLPLFKKSKYRFAITGLSQSGKTTLITSVVNILLHHQANAATLQRVPALEGYEIMDVRVANTRHSPVPEFEYGRFIQDLQGLNHPQGLAQWPKATETDSQITLEVSLRPAGTDSQPQRLELEFYDYPGEWLVDLALLDLDFVDWCLTLNKKVTRGSKRQALLQESGFLAIQQLDFTSTTWTAEQLNEHKQRYVAFLKACKQQGLNNVQPGRFLLENPHMDFRNYPLFFPVLGFNGDELRNLDRTTSKQPNSLFQTLKAAYDSYQKQVVNYFKTAQFNKFDRQLVLVDTLTSLNHGYESCLDTSDALNAILRQFKYGHNNLLSRWFFPSIENIMFVATKCDRVLRRDAPNMLGLMQALLLQQRTLQQDEADLFTPDTASQLLRKSKTWGQKISSTILGNQEIQDQLQFCTISAVQATQEISPSSTGAEEQAANQPYLEGRLRGTTTLSKVHPPAVPKLIPPQEYWQQDIHFADFEPRQVTNNYVAHRYMEQVLNFLFQQTL